MFKKFTARILLNRRYYFSSPGVATFEPHRPDASCYLIMTDVGYGVYRVTIYDDFELCYFESTQSRLAREFARNYINGMVTDRFDMCVDLPRLPVPRRGAPIANQNAKKERTVKIQFRLDDPAAIEFLENYSNGSISQAAREILLEGFLFRYSK